MNSNQFGETVNWLLEPDNPSVRYFTLTCLLDESPDQEESVSARQSIMETGVVPEILSRQSPEGFWGDPKRFYTDKYRGTVWQLMYQTDILEILDILTGLGIKDDRMREAVDILAAKQDPEGRWNLENSFNGKFQVNIERIGKPSKWITLRALRVLKRYYGEIPVPQKP